MQKRRSGRKEKIMPWTRRKETNNANKVERGDLMKTKPIESVDDMPQSVPWFSSLEWLETAKNVSSTGDRVRLLNNLRLWRARCDALPTGVDTTLVLLAALECGQKETVDDLGRRLALSAAVTRFLNHALMMTMQKDPFNETMFKRAKGADLPSWMVKLRHEAAHGKAIPALQPLLDAANIALDWLRNNYWHIPPLDWQPQEPFLDPLIDEWEALSACLHSGYKKVTSLPDPVLKAQCEGIKTVADAIRRAEGKILSAAAKNPEALMQAILSCSQTFLSPPPGLYGREELPLALVNQWQMLLAFMHSVRLLPALITKLHEKDTRLASLWIVHLLEVFEKLRTSQTQLRAFGVVIKDTPCCAKFVQKRKLGEPDKEVEAKVRQQHSLGVYWPLFAAAPTAEELSLLAFEVASKPNKNGRTYIQKLLELSELDSAKKDQIKKLWSIYFGEIQNEPEGDIKSLDDLMHTNIAQEETEKWIKCSDWNAKAVGLLPWQDGHQDLTLDYHWE